MKNIVRQILEDYMDNDSISILNDYMGQECIYCNGSFKNGTIDSGFCIDCDSYLYDMLGEIDYHHTHNLTDIDIIKEYGNDDLFFLYYKDYVYND